MTALYAAMHYPHVFGAVLAESPSLWIAEGAFLNDMWQYRGPLPERLFMGCGTLEYSATRDHVRCVWWGWGRLLCSEVGLSLPGRVPCCPCHLSFPSARQQPAAAAPVLWPTAWWLHELPSPGFTPTCTRHVAAGAGTTWMRCCCMTTTRRRGPWRQLACGGASACDFWWRRMPGTMSLPGSGVSLAP